MASHASRDDDRLNLSMVLRSRAIMSIAFLLFAGALHVADTLIKIVNGHLNSAIDDLLPWAYAPREELLRGVA